jgi:pimeloyl-ACP methyl ester carboxylesterase
VDAVAARTGEPVALFGHSYGAGCAMGGATLTNNVAHLVLYEPSLGTAYPPGSLYAIETSIAAGDLDGAAVAVLALIGMSQTEIEAMRASQNPGWSTRIAAAWTLPREARVEESWTYQPGQHDTIEAPTLLLAGSASPPDLVSATHHAADAIPNAQIRVLEGHGHMAHKTDPTVVANIIRTFVATGVPA